MWLSLIIIAVRHWFAATAATKSASETDADADTDAFHNGARRRTGSTFALSITGEAGPEPSEKVPVGTVYVGLADAAGCLVVQRQFFGDRARIRVFATQMALDMLRKKCTLVAV